MTGSSESYGKGNCQFCDFICDKDTFSTKACGETFKIQSRILNCNSQKVIYVGKLLMLVRKNRNLKQDLIIIKVHTGLIKKT